jgi:hypothetical protein
MRGWTTDAPMEDQESTEEQVENWVEQFHRDGFLFLEKLLFHPLTLQRNEALKR